MLILALDTTTRGGSIAVTRDDTLLALVPGDATRTHGERVPDEMARALAEAGVVVSAIDLLAVASGPGGFTGLRIGLAAVQGLAMALGRPVAGVPTLDALAWTEADALDTDGAVPGGLVVPWMDGQRGDVFAAVYARTADPGAEDRLPGEWRRWTVLEEASVGRPALLLDRWGELLRGRPVVFVGDAAGRDRPLIEAAGAGLWQSRLPGPLAPAVARIGRRLALAGQAGLPHDLAPVYARRPDAEIERDWRGAP